MSSVASMSAVGLCPGVTGWSPADAASSQSALAGVLAGFVFSGLVVVLTVRRANRDEEAASALKLLLCAFFGLGVTAYLLAEVAGDGNCLRSYTEEAIVGGMLGTFAIVMIVSLTWLVVAYDQHARGVLRFLRRLVHVATAFVVLLLCASSLTCLQAEVPQGPSIWASVMLFVVGGLFYIAATPVGVRGAKFLAARVGMYWLAQDSPDPAVANWLQKMRNPVTDCIWAALGYLGMASIADTFVLSGLDVAWARPKVFETYVVVWIALILSLGVLVLAMRAMAPEGMATPTSGEA